MKKRFLLTLYFSIFCLFPSFSSAKVETIPLMNADDPYQAYNRAVFRFNNSFNEHIGQPVAEAYIEYVPKPAQTGFANFFSNLSEPISAINSFLQGKGEDGFTHIMRFSLNSTLGLFGLIDIATPAGLNDQNEDLGQTLAHWEAWTESSFIMIPFVGPYTTRELVGSLLDSGIDPTYPYLIKTDDTGRIALYVGDKFVDYAKVVHLTGEMLNQPDPYVFMRESYLQYRMNLIYDGNPPQPDLDDFDFE